MSDATFLYLLTGGVIISVVLSVAALVIAVRVNARYLRRVIRTPSASEVMQETIRRRGLDIAKNMKQNNALYDILSKKVGGLEDE